MVLQELGKKLSGALSKLNRVTIVDEELFNDVLKEISAALMHSDVNIRIVMSLRNNIKKNVNLEELTNSGSNVRKIIQKAVFDELVNMLSPEKMPFVPKKGTSNVFMFVGLQGSGKTTTVAKFAHYWKRKGWKTAMIACDTFRAGAFDQLKQNAIKVKVPFYGSYTESDPVKIARDGAEQFRSEGYEIIIVDTSGRHKQEGDLFEEMEQVLAAIEPDEVIFTMDSTGGSAVGEQAAAFKSSVPVGSVIITKLDGNAKGGGALSAVAATDSPITFIGTGEHFDNFEKFDPPRFVSRLLGLGDLKGLLETFHEKTDIFENAPQMYERLSKGLFTLRDMRDQFQTVLKMGNIGSLMSMIPGMAQLMPEGSEKDGVGRIQIFLTIMDSMTDDELDGVYRTRKRTKDGKGYSFTYEKQISASRIDRIARGSGTNPNAVQVLLKCHKQFEKFMGKMGKSQLMRGGDSHMAQALKRNPQQILRQLGSAMDPRMMAQMGGAKGMMNMFQQIANSDTSEMLKSMGGMAALGGAGGSRKKGRRRR